MSTTQNRLASSELTSEDRALLEQISREVFGPERPALIGSGNERIPLPEPIYQALVRVVRAMQDGETIMLTPENETMTSQAAANYLGVSRPFLIKILEENKIPFHHVGTHRRVQIRDLREYEKQRDKERRVAMKGLFDKIQEAGKYDAVDTGEDAG